MAMSRALRTLTRSYRFFSEKQASKPKTRRAESKVAAEPAAPKQAAPPRAHTASGVGPVEALLRERFTVDQYRDCFKVASQGVQWTYTELNRYTSAFAFGLLELGLTPGDKVAFWTCKCDSSETVAIQLACARAGLAVHPVPSNDQLSATLQQAKLLVLSPWIAVKGTEGKRVDEVLKLIPELKTTHWGSPLKSGAFPGLKYVVQLGFSTIRGTVKGKNVAVYGKEDELQAKLSSQADSVFLDYSGTQFTQQSLVELSQSLASELQLAKGHTVLNLVNPKNPSSLLGTLTSWAAGARAVLPGTEKQLGRLAAAQKPQVVLVDSAVDLTGCEEVETLVVADETSDAVASIASKLRDVYRLKAKKIVGVHPQTLKRL